MVPFGINIVMPAESPDLQNSGVYRDAQPIRSGGLLRIQLDNFNPA